MDMATPKPVSGGGDETRSMKKRSRWDDTPAAGAPVTVASTPGATPLGNLALTMATPSSSAYTPEVAQQMRWEAEVDERNRPLSDAELDAIFPATGYKILDTPASYVPIMTPHRKLLATPTPMGATPGFAMNATPARESYGIVPATPSDGTMPFIKPEDQ